MLKRTKLFIWNFLLFINCWILFSIPAQASKIQKVDSTEVLEMLNRGVVVIDIRRRDEWVKTGVIKGSHLMTAFDQNGVITQDFPLRFSRLVKKDQEVVLICHSGGRTYYMTRALNQQLGYKKLFDANLGIIDWSKKGFKLIEADLASGL